MPELSTTSDERDGFEVVRIATREVVNFVPCSATGRERERTLMGMLINANTDDYFIRDTRDA